MSEKNVEEVCDNAISMDFSNVLEQLLNIQTQVKSMVTVVKKLEKNVNKEINANNKTKKKSKDKDKAPRPLSGFAKPTLISQELCKFLNKDSGTEMARTDVTKIISQYIKDNNLQNPKNRREILPDKKLKNLLKVSDSDNVTYFNLQKYMKHHFIKTAPVPVA